MDGVNRLETWKRALRSVPMVVKMMGIALGMAVLLASGLSWQIYRHWQADEMSELDENGRWMAHLISARSLPMLRSGDTEQLRELLRESVKAIPEINAIEMRDGQGRVAARIGPINPQARVRVVTVPVSGELGGSVVVDLSNAQVLAELASLTRRLLLTIGAIAGIGMAGAWWAARMFTGPIKELVTVTRAVAGGDFKARARIVARDEVGELAGAFNEMVAELQHRKEVESQLQLKLIRAEDEERKTVARELHDHTSQALTSIIAGLASIESGPQPARRTGDLLAVATQALAEVHDLSRSLRPLALDDLGLDPALRKLCEASSRRLGIAVTFQTTGFEGSSRLPHPLELALYQISQEAITNAMRHGNARSVALMVHRRPESVLAVIEDDGKGFDARDWRANCLRGDHVGLLSMEQRATLLGGRFWIESRTGGGTTLFVEFPLPLS